MKGTTTRSPTLSFLFSDPTSTTSPMVSWPRTSPLFIEGMTPSKKCRSEPQIAQAVTLMMASRAMLDLGIRHGVAANVVLAVPRQGFHSQISSLSSISDKLRGGIIGS